MYVACGETRDSPMESSEWQYNHPFVNEVPINGDKAW